MLGPDQRLTYAELNARANRLAHHLIGLGVKPETLVGLCAERSVEMVVGLLGILKAGGAYVPLDPGYPQERLEYMIRDSGLRIVVIAGELAAAVLRETAGQRQPGDELRVVQLASPSSGLDNDWDKIASVGPGAAERASNPSSGVGPQNAAYVIYTSGSTGQPKGVVVEHASVVNHNMAAAQVFRLTAEDAILQFSTINFDAAVEEMFPAWSVGARVVLRPAGMLISGEELLELVEREKLTVLDLPTAYWHEWVYELGLLAQPSDSARQFLPPSLRLMVVGGDKASAEHLVKWRALAGPGVAWMNTYGPTEGTIIASSYELDAGAEIPSTLPIGRPLPNMRLYILDSRGEPVPVGVPGELWIAGAGVARGYLNRPDLTANSFCPDPFCARSQRATSGERMYRTGDLARFRADGNIEFLGRNDDQVKIRGFRVELGEIERALKQREDVRDAVVVAREDGEGRGKRLVAYVASGVSNWQERPVDGPMLRAYLQGKLPDYMVPATYIVLDALPLTATGKVDRRALPEPARALDDPEREETADVGHAVPRTPQEEVLARIWAEVLGLERVGIDQNFFELGGDSILSIQVIARANQMGLRLTPKQLFQAPTVAALAAEAANAAAEVATPTAEQGIVEGDVPLTPIQRWFFDQQLQDQEHWNQAVLLQTTHRLQPALLERAVAQLLMHHDALRLRFREGANGWEQWHSAQEVPAPRVCSGAFRGN